MKKVIKAIGITSLLLLYFFAVNYIGGNALAVDSAIANNQAPIINNCLESSSSPFFINQIQNENIVERSNNIPTPVRKTHHFNAFANSKPVECNQISDFTKFISYITNTVIQFRKTDIIFPFHFFL